MNYDAKIYQRPIYSERLDKIVEILTKDFKIEV